MTETAADQLRRLLALVPLLADGEAHALGRVARLVDADEQRVWKDLRALVDRFAPQFPERHEDWRLYLAYLGDFADSRGTLPASFEGLVLDVFGDLIDHDSAHGGAARKPSTEQAELPAAR